VGYKEIEERLCDNENERRGEYEKRRILV